jgi:hypothetical protein
MLHFAVLGRISAVESLAASLQARGADPSGIRNTLQSHLLAIADGVDVEGALLKF